MLSERTSNALAGISKSTLKEGVRVKHLFRIMTHCPDLWMQAYANIYANKGAVTKGVTDNTLDGMCQDRVENLINLLKDGRYWPQPVKRVYIPKANGKKRPLGIPTGDDKLVQEVVKILLELVYEPNFSDCSHGFRRGHSCHTALRQIKTYWKGTKWVVDMDISAFYDSIDHRKMIEVLEKKIDDKRFIDLIKLFLQAGYLEDWKFYKTYSGTPQGGICSPILANVFLHELDTFMKEKAYEFSKGKKRADNPEYGYLNSTIGRFRRFINNLEEDGGDNSARIAELHDKIRTLNAQRSKLSSQDPYDPNFRRFYYVRYADDFAIGIVGSKDDADRAASEVKEFIENHLNLKIAEDKSGIRHIKRGFDFLGYHVSLNRDNNVWRKTRHGTTAKGKPVYRVHRSLTSQLQLQVPKEKVWEFCRKRNYLRELKPIYRPELQNLSDYEIVSTYNAEMRGFANYYCLAPKLNLNIMEWSGTISLYKTLAQKHKTSWCKVKCRMKFHDEHVLRYEHGGKEKMLNVYKLKHRISDRVTSDIIPTNSHLSRNTELLQRMNANKCEYCGKTGGYFEVHHVRKLKDIKAKKDKLPWEIRMCARLRKTMVLCHDCHRQLHNGELPEWKRDLYTKGESAVR